ncbi:putative PurR-regulated permease PerM [Leucobacter exalbidus]|uniref:PurR-regulated permease PerM n=1 Tax=Leucobacter exalbidus TaxID=662960 RepID=A0A940PXC3_9MICO|nr:AI-2E family transporter [Leucobacter exalbidus]MBP1325901.1 putative PurR-regulated permease PerM [Leucobacter exalbidus]
MSTADESGTRAANARTQHSSTEFSRVRKLGIVSWSAVGVIVLAVVIAGGISALSGILVPLIIAVILGTVLEPVVTWLANRKVPRPLAAAVVLIVATALAVGIVAIVVRGFVQQIPEISQQLMRGWVYVLEWLHTLDIDAVWIEQLRKTGIEYLSVAGSGAMGLVTGAVYGAVSFAVGSFFALYFLFFVLRDGRVFPAWLARVTGRDEQLVTEIDANVRQSLRGYFSGTALTALITGPIFVIPLLVLGIPLVIPTIILYFILSFIPFVGAWLTAGFAVLIAFGFGGPSAALIVTLSLLVSNGPIQNVVLSWALGSSLKLHPVMVLVATIGGGVVAGVLGMVLGPPVMSALQKAVTTVRQYREERDGDGEEPASAVGTATTDSNGGSDSGPATAPLPA